MFFVSVSNQSLNFRYFWPLLITIIHCLLVFFANEDSWRIEILQARQEQIEIIHLLAPLKRRDYCVRAAENQNCILDN